jgi:dihydroorotate dehydrogenase electron transfer subunit
MSSAIVEILKINKEKSNVKTFRFNFEKKTKPGQFFMVWIPGIDEIPMSVSYIEGLKGITIENIGEATNSLHKLKIGDKIGIRGPYGNGFKIFGKKILLVGGGTGIIPLAPLAEKIMKKEITIIVGAQTKSDILFKERIKKATKNILISTDDGSLGYKGFASDSAKKIMEKKKFDLIITCGPEVMMKKIVDIANKMEIPIQASLERYMKCGVGICDSCSINGLQVCKDGPVFSGDVLKNLEEFGKRRRDACGRAMKV